MNANLPINQYTTQSPPRRIGDVRVSLVIPCFNEVEVLPMLFDRIAAAADAWESDVEIIIVDDGSTDRSWDLICERRRCDPRFRGIRLARNFGHQIAVWTGLHHSTGQVIAVLDGDLQDPPEILPQFFAKWAEGYDVIYAVRQKRKEGPLKRAAYFLYYRALAFVSEINIPLDSGDFCVLDRRPLAAMLASREQMPFVRGLRAWVGFRQTALAYERDRRAAGEVKYTLRKLMQLGLNGIFSFSTRPLRLAAYLGLLVSATAFGGVALIVLQRIFAEQFTSIGLAPVPGYASLVMAILFLGGVQLLCIGILGEYIGRIYENVKGRPLTVISETIGVKESAYSADLSGAATKIAFPADAA